MQTFKISIIETLDRYEVTPPMKAPYAKEVLIFGIFRIQNQFELKLHINTPHNFTSADVLPTNIGQAFINSNWISSEFILTNNKLIKPLTNKSGNLLIPVVNKNGKLQRKKRKTTLV